MSKDSKHTPGPWLIAGEDGCTIYAVHHNGDFKDGKPFLVNRFYARVEDCRFQGGTADEARANGRLIAAAPDLLEALQKCVSVFEKLADAGNYPEPLFQKGGWMFAAEAIAKATGGVA